MVRKLSSLEQYFYVRSAMNLNSGFSLAITLNKLPNKQQLCFALTQTIKKHPQLHGNVFPNDNNSNAVLKSFETEPIEFQQVIEYKNDWTNLDSSTVNYIYQNYNFEYGVEKPLWKIFILPKCNMMVLLVDHALCDGISTVKFWQTVMDNLNGSQQETILFKPNGTEYATFLEPHPYDLIPVPWSWKLKRFLTPYILKHNPDLVTKVNPDFLQFNKYQFPNDLLSNSEKDHYEVKNNNDRWTLKVTSAKLSEILKFCKQHSVTFTSYLVASIIVSLNKHEFSDTNNGSRFNVDIPMNTRPKCKELLNLSDDKVQMGNFVGPLEFNIERSSIKDIWQVATEVKQFLSKHSKDDILSTINQVKLLDVVDSTDYINYKLANIGPGGVFEVTSLGFQRFAGDTEYDNAKDNASHEFTVLDAIFDEPQNISDIFTCSVISTVNGGLTCRFSIPEPLVDDLAPVWDDLKEFYR